MSDTAIYQARYFCRGCGQPLPPGFRGQFHAGCLREDKKRRIREQRRKEQEKFRVWLRKQVCQNCGVRGGEIR